MSDPLQGGRVAPASGFVRLGAPVPAPPAKKKNDSRRGDKDRRRRSSRSRSHDRRHRRSSRSRSRGRRHRSHDRSDRRRDRSRDNDRHRHDRDSDRQDHRDGRTSSIAVVPADCIAKLPPAGAGVRLTTQPIDGSKLPANSPLLGGFTVVEANTYAQDVEVRLNLKKSPLRLEISGLDAAATDDENTVLTMLNHHSGGSVVPIFFKWGRLNDNSSQQPPDRRSAFIIVRSERDATILKEHLDEKFIVSPFGQAGLVARGSRESLAALLDRDQVGSSLLRITAVATPIPGNRLLQEGTRVLNTAAVGGDDGWSTVQSTNQPPQQFHAGASMSTSHPGGNGGATSMVDPPHQMMMAPLPSAPSSGNSLPNDAPPRIATKIPTPQERKFTQQRFVPHGLLGMGDGWMATCIATDTLRMILQSPAVYQLQVEGLDSNDTLDLEEIADMLSCHSGVQCVYIAVASSSSMNSGSGDGHGATAVVLGFRSPPEAEVCKAALHEQVLLSPFGDRAKLALGSKEMLSQMQSQMRMLHGGQWMPLLTVGSVGGRVTVNSHHSVSSSSGSMMMMVPTTAAPTTVRQRVASTHLTPAMSGSDHHSGGSGDIKKPPASLPFIREAGAGGGRPPPQTAPPGLQRTLLPPPQYREHPQQRNSNGMLPPPPPGFDGHHKQQKGAGEGGVNSPPPTIPKFRPKLPPTGQLLKIAPNQERGGYTCLDAGLSPEALDMACGSGEHNVMITGLNMVDSDPAAVVTMLYYHSGVMPVWWRWELHNDFRAGRAAFATARDATVFIQEMGERFMVAPDGKGSGGLVAKGTPEQLTALKQQHVLRHRCQRFALRVLPCRPTSKNLGNLMWTAHGFVPPHIHSQLPPITAGRSGDDGWGTPSTPSAMEPLLPYKEEEEEDIPPAADDGWGVQPTTSLATDLSTRQKRDRDE